MTSILVAFICTLVAAGVLSYLTEVPPFTPFPELNPDPLPVAVSAAVAEARGHQWTAEKGQDWAERVAAVQGREAARLLIENKKLRERLRTATAQITALEELKLPAAVELVSKISGLRQDGDRGGDGDGSESASSTHTPKGAGRR